MTSDWWLVAGDWWLVLRFLNNWHFSQLPNQVRSEGTALLTSHYKLPSFGATIVSKEVFL